MPRGRPRKNVETPAIDEPDVPDIPELTPDDLSDLSEEEVESALSTIREVKQEAASSGKVAELSQAISSLTVEEFARLIEKNPALSKIVGAQLDKQAELALKKAGPLPPGTIVGEGLYATKVRWDRRKMEEMYEMVEIVPMTNRTVQVNGVQYHLVARQVNRVPSIIRDVYLQSIEMEVENDRFRDWYFRKGGGGFEGTWTPGFDHAPQGAGEAS